MRVLLLMVFFGFLMSCHQKQEYHTISTKSKDGYVQAVIEIPAGTNKKYEYNKESHVFEIDTRDGIKRTINFLPYPGNYGFIPSTFSNPKTGGDGDALDVLLISEALQTGTVIEIIPIAVLKLIDNNEEDHKVIAIPRDPSLQIISPANFKEFIIQYPEIQQIIELWFSNYDKSDTLLINGWGDEKEAILEINKNPS